MQPELAWVQKALPPSLADQLRIATFRTLGFDRAEHDYKVSREPKISSEKELAHGTTLDVWNAKETL